MEFGCVAFGYTGNMHLVILSSKAPLVLWELKNKEVDIAELENEILGCVRGSLNTRGIYASHSGQLLYLCIS